jgi:hypothetical protein
MSSSRPSSPSILGAACGLVFLAACTATPSPTSTLAATLTLASPTSTLAKTAEMVPSVTPIPVTTLVALPTLATPIFDSGTPYVAPTVTSPPFPVKIIATSIYSPGTPAEDGYAFANPDDLRAARNVYEQYFALMSFSVTPPPTIDDIKARAAQYRDLSPNPALNAGISDSCSFDDVVALIQQYDGLHQYFRIEAGSLEWSDQRLFLALTPSGVSLQTDWSTTAVVQLMDRNTGKPVREKQMHLLGTASLTIKDGRWIVEGEGGGFYCLGVRSFGN